MNMHEEAIEQKNHKREPELEVKKII
jgi:hypothetical protein